MESRIWGMDDYLAYGEMVSEESEQMMREHRERQAEDEKNRFRGVPPSPYHDAETEEADKYWHAEYLKHLQAVQEDQDRRDEEYEKAAGPFSRWCEANKGRSLFLLSGDAPAYDDDYAPEIDAKGNLTGLVLTSDEFGEGGYHYPACFNDEGELVVDSYDYDIFGWVSKDDAREAGLAPEDY